MSNVTFINLTAKREGKEFIGDSVVRVLNQVQQSSAMDGYEMVAVVPRILAPFGANSKMEVVEADIIIKAPR